MNIEDDLDIEFELDDDDSSIDDASLDSDNGDNLPSEDRDQENADSGDSEAFYLRQQLAEAQGKIEALSGENAKNSKENLEWQINYVDVVEQSLSRDISDLTRKLARAEEDGETETKIELQEKIDDARTKKNNLSAAKNALSGKLAKLGEAPEKPDNPKSDSGKPPELSSAGKEWVARNQWIVEPKNSRDEWKQFLGLKIDRQMRQEQKFIPDSKAYYAELDKRIAAKMKENSENSGSGKNRSKVPSAPGQNGGGGNQGGERDDGKVRINPAQMRILGLNPKDKEHVKEYARQVRESDRAGNKPVYHYPTMV